MSSPTCFCIDKEKEMKEKIAKLEKVIEVAESIIDDVESDSTYSAYDLFARLQDSLEELRGES